MVSSPRSRRARLLRIGLVALAVIGSASTPTPAQATPTAPTDLPPGFTDGVAVGGPNGPEEPRATTTEPSTRATRAATQRYFGADPWHAIEASAAATTRSCSLSDNGLTAMVVSPVFKESSGATTSSTAPSPMTLSRYDEWTGVMATDTNRNANYGLYAFRDPNTAYKRAYWHPGIGIWQYDTAGVGAPFTAIERMDVGTVSADVAAGMAARYCNPSASLIGHAAPFTGEERRNAAWAPWGYPCTLCEQAFQDMTASATDFANIHLVSGISVTGGAKARTCSLAGGSGTVLCWYVDPSVGTIEGATGWATIDPDGGSPTVAPAPLSKPFYVLERNGREERHWLTVDTGYGTSISGWRTIGLNDRPRSNQPGSGITWSASSGLCDLTARRGDCLPTPPSGITSTDLAVGGTYRPISLDATGDGKGDILWYAPGAKTDPLFVGQGSGGFATVSQNIGGTYGTVLPLDADGDGDDDILWYERSTGASYLWWSDGDGTFTPEKLTRPKGLRPLAVDRDADGADEIFWYAPGSGADLWWDRVGSFWKVTSRNVSGTFTPLVGDFDHNGREDIFWYAPGTAKDALWLHSGSGSVVDVAVGVSGTYRPLLGDFDGDGASDIFWYAAGGAADSLWFGGPGGAFDRRAMTVTTTYVPFVADLLGDGRDDIVWYLPGSGRDPWWTWSTGRTVTGSSIQADTSHQAIVGAFSARGTDGIVWYLPGGAPDSAWWH